MAKPLFYLIFMAMLVFTGMTMSQNFLLSWDNTACSFAEVSEMDRETLRIDISMLSASINKERNTLEVALKNNGQAALSSFEQWDCIIQYYDYTGDYRTIWFPYVAGEPDDNQWTVKGIYLSAAEETPETLEPGILNPGEEMIIQVELNPVAGKHTTNLAIISTPKGVTSSIHFQA